MGNTEGKIEFLVEKRQVIQEDIEYRKRYIKVRERTLELVNAELTRLENKMKVKRTKKANKKIVAG